MEYHISIFKNGTTTAPGPEMYYLSDWEKEYTLYTYFFLVRGNGHNILIDTGCGDIEAINKMLFEEFKGKVSFELPESETTENILKRNNIEPKGIEYVFISHLHHDHSSNVDLFPNAKVILSRKGWMEYMKKDKPYYYNDILFPTKPIKYLASLHPDRLIFVENEKEILPGISAFWVGGHTPGCMAVEVNTRMGNAVFTSDVAFFVGNVKKNHPIGLYYNQWEIFEAYRKIREKADIIIPSHDPTILDEKFKDGKI
ncbi:MAG: N-acyl homoserine lactonase family protein [Actinomycetota bacterium]